MKPLAMTIPVVGPTGERDNVYRFLEVISALVPDARVFGVSVAHDDDCPCISGELDMGHCTCSEVGVLIENMG